MSKLPAKTNDLLLRFFAKPHLVEVLLIMIVTYKIGLVHTILFQYGKFSYRSRAPEKYFEM